MRSVFLLFMMLSMGCAKSLTHLNKQNEVLKEVAYLKEAEVQLSEPQIEIDSLIFKNSALVTMLFAVEDAQIKYALNDSKFEIYREAIEIKESSLLRVHSIKEGFIPSKTKEIQLINDVGKLNGAAIEIRPLPSEQYPGSGAATLIDLEKGTRNFRDGNKWLGFDKQKITINLTLPQPKEINKVYLSVLIDHSSWIFAPESITLYINEAKVKSRTQQMPLESEPASMKMYSLKLNNSIRGSRLKVEIQNLSQIPSWHAGKGTPPWLFIDEIIVE